MVNKVILEGKLTQAPYLGETKNGGKKALFTLEITTYEDGATTKYIEVEAYGKNADKVAQLTGGETIYVEGKLYAYQSTKYDKWMLAVSGQDIEVKKEMKQECEEEVKYQISEDDLPF